MQLKAGDVVRLKSGGPKMTIGWIDDEGTCFCQWFDGNDIKSGTFNKQTLAEYDSSSSNLRKRRPITY